MGHFKLVCEYQPTRSMPTFSTGAAKASVVEITAHDYRRK